MIHALPQIFLSLWGGGRVNLYLTDPPYNVAYEGKTKDALTIENDSVNNPRLKAEASKSLY